MSELRSNTNRAKTAIILVAIVLGFEILNLISDYFQYQLLQASQRGEYISMDEADINDIRQAVLGSLHSIAYIISAIFFIKWFRRAYYNLKQKVGKIDYAEGWAAGSWFVPILNLYRPYQIMKEIFEATDIYIKKNNPNPNVKLNTGILGIWWTLWIISNVIGQISSRMILKAETTDEMINSTFAYLISGVVGVALAIVTLIMIKNYSVAEKYLFELKEEDKEESIVEAT